MPIYEFGYRGYDGPLGSSRLRWLVIARQGVKLAMRSKLLRRMLFLSWTPMLYLSVVFFMVGSITEITPKTPNIPGFNEPGFWKQLAALQTLEQNTRRLRRWQRDSPVIEEPPFPLMREPAVVPGKENAKTADGAGQAESLLSKVVRAREEIEAKRREAKETITQLVHAIPAKDKWLFERVEDVLGPHVALRLVYDAPSVRSAAWTMCFYDYVVRVQTLVMIFVVMMVAPPLVANDLRGRSFLIYFSSAITRRDYIVGKLAVVMSVIASVTILPGLALYAISIAFAPSIGALADTYHVVLRMSLVIFVLGVPASLGALYLSARTTHPRFAAFSWIAIWVMGAIFETAISATASRDSWLHDWVFLLSPYRIMTVLTEWIFGVRGELEAIGAGHSLIDRLPPTGNAPAGLVFVIILSVLAIIGIRRRITAPISI